MPNRTLPNRTLVGLLGLCLLPLTGCDPGHADPAAQPATELSHQRGAQQDPHIIPDFGTLLSKVEGVSDFEEVESEDPKLRIFHFNLEQPVFHGQEGSETFKQRMILVYKDALAPTVLRTLGYSMRGGTKLSRYAAPLGANELLVEHRYFGTSTPESLDYQGLRIRESADDLHRVVQRFRPLLWGSWISAGASKGGMTALYHRRFYPFDTQATLAYVAPNSFGKLDRKYREFLDQVGTPACREKILDYQKRLLANKAELVSTIPELPSYEGVTFELMPGGLGEALERGVHEVEFALWQYFGDELLAQDCAQIPGEDASVEEMAEYRPFRIGLLFSGDRLMRRYASYYLQTQLEIGFPAWRRPELAPLYTVDVEDITPYLMGAQLDPFDPLAMLDIGFWTSVAIDRSIMIYGDLDPYTVRAFELSDPRIGESYVLRAPNATHQMGLDDLPEPAKATAIDALKRWTGATWTPQSNELASPQSYGNIDEDPKAMLNYLSDRGRY